jgi:PTS system nitrogen regulatory IIA component
MPYRVFSVDEVAQYLHLSRAAVEALVKDGQIPCEKRGDRTVFRKREVDAWASQRILGLRGRGLAEYHQKSSHDTRELFQDEVILPELIQPEFIHPAMNAKTKASVVRELVALAEKTGRVYDSRELLASVDAREQLCSTALPGGLALLHSRHHQPYMFESSFIVLGRTIQEIHFGAPDDQPADLFFLICCQDDRIHLHTLARLCLVAQKTDVLTQLRQAPDADAMHTCLLAAEQEALQGKKPFAK